MPRRRRRSPLRALLVTAVVLVILALGALGAAVALVDPNAYKPQIAAAVKRATGRDLLLAGPITLARSLIPTVEVNGVALSNVAGGSQPEMLAIGRAEAEIALWPLLSRRVVVTRLVLIEPDLLLETDAQGRSNWQFTPDRPPATPSESTQGEPSARAEPRLVVETVHVRNGRLVWHDRRTGVARMVLVPRLDATAGTGGGEARGTITGEVSLANQAISITAETGSLERMQNPTATSPWPLHMSLTAAGAQISASGTAARPLELAGYNFVLDGAVQDLATLSTLAGMRLPPLRDVHLAGNVSDAGGRPSLSAITLHAGPSDLSSIGPGLQVDRVDVTVPQLDQPIRAGVQGTLAGAPLQLALGLGAPLALLAPQAGGPPFPIEMTGQAIGATFSIKGVMARPAVLAGLDLAVSARFPDLAALSSLIGRDLPALRDLSAAARVQDGESGLAGGVVLRDIAIALPQGDVAGEATLRFGAHPGAQATLASKRVDADALLAAVRMVAAPPPSTVIPPSVPAKDASAPAPPRSALVVPAAALPWDRLRRDDADIVWSIAELRSGGSAVRDVMAHAVLHDGRLAFDTQAGPPAPGRPEASVTIDATAAPPTVALVLRAPFLPLRPLLDLFGLPDGAAGSAEIDADLHGVGASPHDLAATLDGHLGVAMVDAEIDNQVLSAALDAVLRAGKLPVDFGSAGRTRLRCLAVRLDVGHGTATANALVLDSTRLLLQGGGTLALGDEALALRLRPLLRVGGPGIVLPVRVGGTLRAPSASLDAAGGAEALASLAGRVAPQSAERGADACVPALAAARGGRPGPAASPAPPTTTKAPNAAEFLRSLGR